MTRAMRPALVVLWMLAGCGTAPQHPGGSAPGGDADAAPGGSPGGSADGSPGAPADGGSGTWFDRSFTNAAGTRSYHVYVPAAPQAPAAPLVMILPGCTTTAASTASTSHYTDVADAQGVLIAIPEQDTAANSAGCWNWFLAEDQVRDQGEPSLLAGIAKAVMTEWPVDAKRVYVIGGSAGGAMSVIMGATYPDVFAAICVMFGCEYAGAPCGSSGGPDPTQQGQKAYQAMGGNARPVPVLIFQGDADPLVAPLNAKQVATQWLTTDDWADDGTVNGSAASSSPIQSSGTVPNGRSYDISRWASPSGGQTVVESWLIHGAGHAWPGGTPNTDFADPQGPDATQISWSFFAAHPHP